MKVHVLTVATSEGKYYYDFLLDTCKKNNFELKVIGLNLEWKGFNMKNKLILNELNKIENLDDIVVVVDAYDVICTRKAQEFVEIFVKIQKEKKFKMLVGKDNLNHTNFINKIIVESYFGKCYGKNLNAGTYCGLVKDLKEVLSGILHLNNEDNADDQQLLTNYCNLVQENEIYIDEKNEIFLTIGSPCNEIFKYVDFTKDNEIIYNNIKPFFLHAPGGSSLDLILKELGYNLQKQIGKEIAKKYNFVHILINEYTLLFIFIVICILFCLIYWCRKLIC